MGGRNRRYDLRRQRATKLPKRRFYILCEGKKTEPGYFSALQKLLPRTIIALQIEKAAGVPLTIAKTAVARAKSIGIGKKKTRNSFEKGDQVWAVFDRDEHPNYEEAIQLCAANNVGVARSNPCFEVWLILHQAEYHRPDNRHEAQAHLKAIRPDYDGKTMDFDEILARLDIAEQRAIAQYNARLAEGEPPGPPHTTVWVLTRAIRS